MVSHRPGCLFFFASGEACFPGRVPCAEGRAHSLAGVSERTAGGTEQAAPDSHLRPGEKSCAGQRQVSVSLNYSSQKSDGVFG